MTGGLIQLESYGIEDKPLISNPEVTYFKQVYRQHTLFSAQEIETKFKGKPQFGGVADCNITTAGDLLQELTLCVDLPNVQVTYPNTVQQEVSNNIDTDKFTLSPSHYRYIHERLNEINGIETYPVPIDSTFFAKTYPWLSGNNRLLLDVPSFDTWSETFWGVSDISANDYYTKQLASTTFLESNNNDFASTIKKFYYPLNVQYLLHVLQKVNIDETIYNSKLFYTMFLSKLKDYIVQSQEFRLIKYIEDRNTTNTNFTDIEYNKSVLVNIKFPLQTKMELEPLLYCYSMETDASGNMAYILKSVLNKKTYQYSNGEFTINTEVFSNNYTYIEDELKTSSYLKTVLFIGSRKEIINSLDLQQISNIKYVARRTVASVNSNTDISWNITYTNDPVDAIEWEIDIAEPVRDVYPVWDTSNNYIVDFNVADDFKGVDADVIEANINKYMIYVYASSKPEEQDITTKEGLFATDDNQTKYIIDMSNNYYLVQNFIRYPTPNQKKERYIPVIFDANNAYDVTYNNVYYLNKDGDVVPVVIDVSGNYIIDGEIVDLNDIKVGFVIDLFRVYDISSNPINIQSTADLSNNFVPVFNPFDTARFIYRGKYYNYMNMYYRNNNEIVNLEYPLDGFPYQTPLCLFYIQTVIGNKVYVRKFAPQKITTNDLLFVSNKIELVNTVSDQVQFEIIGHDIYAPFEIAGYDISGNTYTLNNQNVTKEIVQFYWIDNFFLKDPKDINTYITKQYWSDEQVPYKITIPSRHVINKQMLSITNVELQTINYDVYNNFNFITDKLQNVQIDDADKFNLLVTECGKVTQDNLGYVRRLFTCFLNPELFLSQYVKTDKNNNIIFQPFFVNQHYNTFQNELLGNTTNAYNLMDTKLAEAFKGFTDILDLNFVETVKQIDYNPSAVVQIMSQEYLFGFEITVSEDVTLNDFASIQVDVSSNPSVYDTWDAFTLDGIVQNNTITIDQLAVTQVSANKYQLAILSNYDLQKLLMIDLLEAHSVRVNSTVVMGWRAVFAEPVSRTSLDLVNREMNNHYVLNNVLIDFYVYIMNKVISKLTNTPLEGYFKTYLYQRCWSIIQDIKQCIDNGFSKFTVNDTYPNMYAIHNFATFFNDKNIVNIFTDLINKYFYDFIRPTCIQELVDQDISGVHFYLVENNPLYRADYNDVELGSLNNIELLQWVLYKKNQNDVVFTNCTIDTFLSDISNTLIRTNMNSLLETVSAFLDNEIVTLDSTVSNYTLVTSVNNSVFGPTININNKPINDILIPYINAVLQKYRDAYSFAYILDYFATVKKEYMSLFNNFIYTIYDIGLTTYETFNNIQQLVSFEISDYEKQLDYPRSSPNFDPRFDFLILDTPTMSTENPQNFFFSYELKFRSKVLNYINYFIQTKVIEKNRYFSYKELLNLEKSNETDIITKWQQDMYSINNVKSSFEFKPALEWKVFNGVFFDNLGRIQKIGDDVYVLDASGNPVYYVVPYCIKDPANKFTYIIKDGYFYNYLTSFNVYGQPIITRYLNYNLDVNTGLFKMIQYTYDASGNITRSISNAPPGLYSIDLSDNAIVDVSGHPFFGKFYSSNTFFEVGPGVDISGTLIAIGSGAYLDASDNTIYIGYYGIFFNKADFDNGLRDIVYVQKDTTLYRVLGPICTKIDNWYLYNNTIYRLGTDVYTIFGNNILTPQGATLYVIDFNNILDLSGNRVLTIDGNNMFDSEAKLRYVYSTDKQKLISVVDGFKITITPNSVFQVGERLFSQAVIEPMSGQILYHFGNIPDEQWLNSNNAPLIPRIEYIPKIVDASFNLDTSLNFVKDIINEIFSDDSALQTMSKLNWNLVENLNNIQYKIPILINLLIKNGIVPPDQSWEQYMMVSMWNNTITINNMSASDFINGASKANLIDESVSRYNSQADKSKQVLYWNVTKQKFGKDTFELNDEVQVVPYIYNYYHIGDLSLNTVNDTINAIDFDMVKHIETLVQVYAGIADKTTLQQHFEDLKRIKKRYLDGLYTALPKDLSGNMGLKETIDNSRNYVYDNVWLQVDGNGNPLYDEILTAKNGIPSYVTDLPYGFVYDFSTNKIKYGNSFDEYRMIISQLYFHWNNYLENRYMPELVNKNLTTRPSGSTDVLINANVLSITETFDDIQSFFTTFIQLGVLQKEAYYGIRQYLKSGEDAYLYVLFMDSANIIKVNDYIVLRKDQYAYGPFLVDFAYGVEVNGTTYKLLKVLRDTVFVVDTTSNYTVEGPIKRNNVVKPLENGEDDNAIRVNGVFKNLLYYYDDFSGNRLSDPLYLIISMIGVKPLIEFITRLTRIPFLATTAATFSSLLDVSGNFDLILTTDASGNYTALENLLRLAYIFTDPVGRNYISAIKPEVLQQLVLFVMALEIYKSGLFTDISLNTLIPQLFPQLENLALTFISNPNWIQYILSNNIINPYAFLDPSNNFSISTILQMYPMLLGAVLSLPIIDQLVVENPQLLELFIASNFITQQTIGALFNSLLTSGFIDLMQVTSNFPYLTGYIVQGISTEIFMFIASNPAFAYSLIANGTLYTNYPTVQYLINTDVSNNSNLLFDPSFNGIYTAINNLAGYGLTDVSLNTLLYLIDPSQNTFPYTEFLLGYLFQYGQILYDTQAVLQTLMIEGYFEDLLNTVNIGTLTGLILSGIQYNVDPSLNSILQLIDLSNNTLQAILTEVKTDLSLNNLLELIDPSVNILQVIGTVFTNIPLNSLITVITSLVPMIVGLNDPSLNLLLSSAFASVDIVQLFTQLGLAVDAYPNLIGDLSLNSLIGLLDPSQNLINKLKNNKYLIQYFFSKGLIDVNTNLPSLVSAIGQDISASTFINYIDFKRLKDLSNNFLIESFDVDIFVDQYFTPLFKYLPDIISQIEDEDLFIYTNPTAIAELITNNPETLSQLINPTTILTAINSNSDALQYLINPTTLIRNILYNPDLLFVLVNVEDMFRFFLDSSQNLIIDLFSNPSFVSLIDEQPEFFTSMLDIVSLATDPSFAFLFDNSGNPLEEINEIIQQYPLLPLYLIKYLDPAKISAIINQNPSVLFQIVNVELLLEKVSSGDIPFNRLIGTDTSNNTLIEALQNNTNLIGLLLDINTLKDAIERNDISGGSLGSLLDRGLLKNFIQSIPVEQLSLIINKNAFSLIENNKWLNYFDIQQVTQDPEIQEILPFIIKPQIFTDPGKISFLLDPSNAIVDILGLIQEPAVISLFLDASNNSFQILRTLFSAITTIQQDISGNVDLLYSFITLFEESSLFGLLANRQILNSLNESILKALFSAIDIESVITNNAPQFSQLLIGDISGNSENLVVITSTLDPAATLQAFTDPSGVDILGDFIGLIDTNTIAEAIETRSPFLDVFFKRVLVNSSIILDFATKIFSDLSSNIAGLLSFVDFTALFDISGGNIESLFRYVNLQNPAALVPVINMEYILNNLGLFLGGINTDVQLQQNLFGLVLSVLDPIEILNNPSSSSFAYFLSLIDASKILDISSGSVIMDPYFNWLEYILSLIHI